MPVVAVSIIVSLRFLKFGTARVRKKRRGTRPEELEQEWVTTTEEQLAEERQPGARRSREQQAEERQAQAQQAQPQQAQTQQAQPPQTAEAQAVQMQEQLELQAAQMQEQMQEQMQGQADLQAVQMQEQIQAKREELRKMAEAKPETAKQAREQTQTMLSLMRDWLGSVKEQLEATEEISPEMQELVSPVLDQVEFLMGNMDQLREDIPRLNQQQLQARMGQMQMQMVKMLEQFRGLEGNLPDNISPEAGGVLSLIREFAMEMMAQFQQQAGQIRELRSMFDDEPMEGQKSDLEAALGDILLEAFEEEETMDPHLEALIKSLPYVDIQDLVEKANEILNDLKKGIKLAPGLIHELAGGDS
jgi:hypothetical protein